MATIVAAAAATTLIDVFGRGQDGKVVQIGDLVKLFDFSKIDVRDTENQDFLHTNLAPSMGKLDSDGLQKLDDEMKIMIAGLTKQISQVPRQERSWEKILSICAQSPVLEQIDDGIGRADKLIKSSSSDFKFLHEIDRTIINEFVKLVNDEDVLKSTSIDINVLAEIVAQTGAQLDSFETFFAKHEYHEKKMLDIGVIRYPDIDNPYFKIYRLKLTAWSDSSRIIFHTEDKSGITGEFNMRKYKPRSSVIDNLTVRARQSAIATAESLFD